MNGNIKNGHSESERLAMIHTHIQNDDGKFHNAEKMNQYKRKQHTFDRNYVAKHCKLVKM